MMVKKTSMILGSFVMGWVFFSGSAWANSNFQWTTGVDIPFFYSPEVQAGPHGIRIEGTQSPYSKHFKVKYRLVKKGVWSDEVFDEDEIEGVYQAGKPFHLELKAPKGKVFQIKIDGQGSGQFHVEPY